ncbi:MAG: insulinase family protein [Flavobacteriaceae bacterium]|nr:insulinase family protein [Flavobacteriaceae bacterium]
MRKLVYIFVMALLTVGVQAQVDRSQPQPGPAPKVNLGTPQTFELKNGLKVMVVENHKLPRVSITLSIDNPPFVEGDQKGIHDLTGALMGNGTSKISKEAFQEEIDFMGARINLHASGASANTLSRYFPRVLELMAEGAIDPNFTQNDFDTQLARFIDGLKSEERSVASNAARVENVLVFGANHPAGEFTTEEKLKNLTLNDVKNHYQTYFAPNNAYLIVMGDVKFKDVKKLVNKNFKNWKKGNIPASDYPNPTNVAKTEINFVDMPNAVQSEIAILSSVNLKMTDKDYFAAIIANQIYGGDFNSYLNMNLREANGWTYGARSSIRGNKYVGKFKAGSQVRNEVTDSAVVEAMKELNRIRTEKVSPETLATVKATFIGNFVMDAEKPEVIARQALLTQTQGLPANFYQNYIQNINAVTAEDVQKAAQKYFSHNNARILVVGRAADVLPALEKLPYQINYFDRFGNPTEKPQQKQVGEGVTVKSVLENYIEAIGGDKVKSVKSVHATYEAEVQGMKLNMKAINTSDGKAMNVVSGMGMELSKTVFDGKSGYHLQQGQRIDMDEEEIAAYQYEAHPFPELVLADKPGVSLAGIETFNGKDAYVIVDGKKKTYYDIETGLSLGTSSELEAQGQTISQTMIYGEYKEYDGIKYPSEFTMNVGVDMSFKVQDIKFNEEVSDADFQ